MTNLTPEDARTLLSLVSKYPMADTLDLLVVYARKEAQRWQENAPDTPEMQVAIERAFMKCAMLANAARGIKEVDREIRQPSHA